MNDKMLKPNMLESWILEGSKPIHQEIMVKCEEWKIHEIGGQKI